MKEGDNEKPVALFPTISNPPTFGTILSLRAVEDSYRKIYVVVLDEPKMLHTSEVITMLQNALDKNKNKYVVTSSEADFTKLTTIPNEIPEHDVVITTSTKIFANLMEKGYDNLRLISKLIGYDETMHRTAYHRSIVYEKLKNNVLIRNKR